MKYKGHSVSSIPSWSRRRIYLSSIASGALVMGAAMFIQWLIYDDWLHDSGPLRIVGSFLAGALTFAFSYRLQESSHHRQMEARRRSEAIRLAHDRVRNSLQAIECVTYAHDPLTAEPIKNAVDVIERTLEEALEATEELVPPHIGNTDSPNSGTQPGA
jgi:hypothetical protein